MNKKGSLTPKQVAELLNVHVYTVYSLLKGGELNGYKIKTHWRIKQEDLEKFTNTNVKGGLK